MMRPCVKMCNHHAREWALGCKDVRSGFCIAVDLISRVLLTGPISNSSLPLCKLIRFFHPLHHLEGKVVFAYRSNSTLVSNKI